MHRSTIGALLALTWLAGGAWEWQPAERGAASAQVERLARQIIEQSLLGGDLTPLVNALPRLARSAGTRRRLAERRELLLDRLGPVQEWRTSEVLRDERGYFKVKAQFYATAPSASPKRPFRGISLLFVPAGDGWNVRWIGFWDPVTGSWNVLSDDAPPDAGER